MGRRSRGRPLKAPDGSESALAALGARLRALRKRRALTLEQLSELTGYSCQHLSAVERAQVVPSETLVTACDTSLSANGALITMLAAVIRERGALSLVPPSCDRRRARIQLGLARARLAAGDGENAYRLASSALAVFAGRDSVTGLREVASLRNAFLESGLLPAASALEEQARTLQRRR